MPLYYVRQDLTTMDCDAIVSPSNARLRSGGGLDASIRSAAGPQLEKACRKIGRCPVGEARSAPAFSLPSRWVIFTTGPVWHGGGFGERKKLERCYQSCFAEAQALGCASLAIPLIGTGQNRVPLSAAFAIARRTLEDCLRQSDMTVYLVVFDKRAFVLSKQLCADVQSYIDDHYAEAHRPPRNVTIRYDAPKSSIPGGLPRFSKKRGTKPAEEPFEETAGFARAPEAREEILYDASLCGMPDYLEDTAPLEFDLRVDEPFSLKLLRLIDQKGMDDVACYKKANVSRQTWYKIMNESGYKPNKKTVLSFAVALELTLDETQMLLESVGFVLSQSSLFDVILMYCLSHGIYDVATIDALLFRHDQETLYSKA